MKKQTKEILVNSNPFETRVAVTEDGKLVEFYVEMPEDRGITGNIYKGRVVRVLPGMQAAFVDVGLDRTAFLHVSDIGDSLEDVDIDGGEGTDGPEGGKGAGPEKARIQDLLRQGQEMMVQVAKEPIGTKGARVTSYAALPGRYLVCMPAFDRVGVSRRIENDKERRRLKEVVMRSKPKGFGFIVRTACEGQKQQEIKSDMDFLVKLWRRVLKKVDRTRAPALLYEELDLTLRTVRDMLTFDVDRVVIDSKQEYERAVGFVEEFLPELSGRLALYEGDEPLFDSRGIDIEVAGALESKVWLESGGYLIMDQMEALTAIDVNTGKYVGRKNSEETILRTNLEAVTAVVHQLRLRNIGGIIVIDFIDMARGANRSRVYNALKDALTTDKARTNILKISELGIVEMTRKRVRESLGHSLCSPCPYCDGNGFVKATDTVLMEIYRELLRELPLRRRKAVLYANPVVAERLIQHRELVEDLENRFRKKLVVKPVETFHREQYEIV